MASSAILSDCGTYRYELTRRWGDGLTLGWIMLNPSTADAEVDDPTIRRCVGFARAWGYGGLTVWNLFALRATDPRELTRHPDPIGPDNDRRLHFDDPATVITAWGARGGDRETEVLARLLHEDRYRASKRVHHLGLTRDGQPRHPLYLKADLTPVAYSETVTL